MRGTGSAGQVPFSPCSQTEALGKRGSGNASGSFIVGGADIGAKIVVGEDSTSGTAFCFAFCFTSILEGSISSMWWDSRLSTNMKCRDWNGVGCLVRMLASECGTSGSCVADGRTNDRITNYVRFFDETGGDTRGKGVEGGEQESTVPGSLRKKKKKGGANISAKHQTGRNLLVLAAFTLSFTFTYTNAQGP